MVDLLSLNGIEPRLGDWLAIELFMTLLAAKALVQIYG
jgi:hypothetical protein